MLTKNNIQPYCITPQCVFIPTFGIGLQTSHLQSTTQAAHGRNNYVGWYILQCMISYTRPVILTGMDRMTSERHMSTGKQHGSVDLSTWLNDRKYVFGGHND